MLCIHSLSKDALKVSLTQIYIGPVGLNTPSNPSVDMSDYSKSEASALGFEPLETQTEKPEISVMKLCDYTQVPNAQVTSAPETKGTVYGVTHWSSKSLSFLDWKGDNFWLMLINYLGTEKINFSISLIHLR